MSFEPIIFYNGEFINNNENEVSFPIEERGFQFGDGIYEVIRIYNGSVYTMEEHMTRLYRSLNEIRISIKWDRDTLVTILEEIIRKNNFTGDGQIYMQVTRGNAVRNHVFPNETVPNIVAYVKAAIRPIETMTNGVKVFLQDDVRWLRCDIKSTNLLPNVLAKQSSKELGGYEAVLHRSGTVTECSSSNVYLVKDNKVYTHPTTNLILNGITRQRIKALCDENGIPFIEEAFHIDDIQHADEMFLSSTTSEVTPIVSVDDKLIGNGQVGSLTKNIQKLYEIDAKLTHRSMYK